MVEPPPMAMQQSASSELAMSRAGLDRLIGVCITAWSKMPATCSRAQTKRTICARPGVEIRSAQLRAAALHFRSELRHGARAEHNARRMAT